ncbi:MAG: hypothetical protein EAZ08_04330 [Cytophagales bacterium]|nr:MAG: hypothetical protein EAZ08_04330 [Cytophagales bacterium]
MVVLGKSESEGKLICDSKLISDLFINGYPTYFIISPEEKVIYISYDAFKPSTDLEAKLQELKITK